VSRAAIFATLFSMAALLALACAGSAEPPRGRRPAPAQPPPAAPETIVQRSIPGQSGGEIRQVARDAAAWRALWAELRQGAPADLLPEEPPQVDFRREMVAVAAMPTQPCIGQVTVRSVVRDRGGLVVSLLEAPPAPNCRCMVASRPLHAVRLPRLEGAVRFVAERGQTPCGAPPPPE
jgi:hypothetical protein